MKQLLLPSCSSHRLEWMHVLTSLIQWFRLTNVSYFCLSALTSSACTLIWSKSSQNHCQISIFTWWLAGYGLPSSLFFHFFLTDGCFLGRDKKGCIVQQSNLFIDFAHIKSKARAIHECRIAGAERAWMKVGNGHVWFLERERFHQISGRGRREAMNTEHIHGVLITIP